MTAPRKRGRPRSPLPVRTMLRSTKASKAEWTRLAAALHMSLNSWLLLAADAAVGRVTPCLKIVEPSEHDQ